MIARINLEQRIRQGIKEYPVTCLLGPRQCGKTTLSGIIARAIGAHWFDMEDPVSFQIIKEAPMITLKPLTGLIVIDEVQRIPEIFQVLRVLSDQPDIRQQFLLLGSASPLLMRQATESLAGRIDFIDMAGFTLPEVDTSENKKLWFRGGFPRSFLARNEEESSRWRQNFIRTFLEQDLPQLGINIPAEAMRRFWMMLAHFHGQHWNGSDFARSIGASEPTARRYLDILSGAYIVRQLQPWYENISKRQVKSPKIYIRDSGILHSLLFLEGDQILYHPKLGSSWEGFIVEQIVSVFEKTAFFWGTHAGAELDLLLMHQGKRIGFEIKYSDAPSLTKSMHVAMHDLQLHQLNIVYPGEQSYSLERGIRVLSYKELKNIDTILC